MTQTRHESFKGVTFIWSEKLNFFHGPSDVLTRPLKANSSVGSQLGAFVLGQLLNVFIWTKHTLTVIPMVNFFLIWWKSFYSKGDKKRDYLTFSVFLCNLIDITKPRADASVAFASTRSPAQWNIKVMQAAQRPPERPNNSCLFASFAPALQTQQLWEVLQWKVHITQTLKCWFSSPFSSSVFSKLRLQV